MESLRLELDERAGAEAPFSSRPESARRAPSVVPEPQAAVEAVYPPTPMQEGMLLHARVAPAAGIDLVQYVFTLRGTVDAGALRRAWELVLARHPALRTAFDWSADGSPRQVVHRAAPLPWSEEDWRPLPPAERDARLAARFHDDRARGFDPATPPLLRVLLARVADDAWRMAWTHHHLLLDGWSAPLVLGEVLAAYAAALRGQAPALPERRPFADYVAWLQGRDPARAETFWRGELDGFTTPTPLPPAASSGGEGGDGVLETRLSAVLTAELRSLGRRCGVTLGTLAQGAWALVLAGASGADDVVFGTAVSGRPAEMEGVEEMVGMFVNTVPVRARLSPGVPVAAWLAGLQERATAAREHEHAPLAQVQRWADVPPGEPLFRTLLAVENYPVDEAAAQARAGFAVELDEVSSRTGFPLTLTVIPGARLRVRLRWDGARYGLGDAERILGWFRAALESIAREPDAPLHAVTVGDCNERRLVVEEWNRTAVASPREQCIHQLFAEQAARTPDAIAVSYGDETLTFAQVHAAANRLARVLRRRGVGPETRVAVCLERGTDAVSALLGVLAAGGVFVPLDPAYPAARLAELLDDSGAAVLVTRARLIEGLPATGAQTLCLDAARDEIAAEAGDALADAGVTPRNLAYVIYTSGSTGRPKGVMVEHRSVANLLTLLDHAIYAAWEGAQPVVSVNGPLTFDTSVKQWVRLLAGSALHLIPDEVRLDGRALAAYLREHRVQVLDCTPAQLRLLLEAGLDEARDGYPADVLVAGEAIDAATWTRLQASTGPRFHNLYGPTECTVDAAVSTVRGAGPVPVIGRPGANVRLYVVDPWGRPVPVGVPGELWIGGEGVARGYLGRPGATAERFVPDPFGGEPGARLYRTGDHARWLASGEVEYLGRIDFQVKIRGFRIEPGEVEAALLRCPGVREAAVLARHDTPGEPRLVAYVSGEGDELGTAPLRARLRGLLPEYMVPSAFVRLDALPRTRHGKVDRAALPAPEVRAEDAGFVAPRTVAEAGIAAIWEEVLGTGPAGADDDFFALGGHSLQLARVAWRIRDAFGVELPLRACFEARTLAELARAVEAAADEGDAAPPLVPVPRDADLPLSFPQARLWYLDQLEPGSTAYVMPTALRLRGPLEADALRHALTELVRRHEVLRTVFPSPDGSPVQAVQAPAPVPLPEVDLRGLPSTARDDALVRLARAEAARPFDLARGPLLRATLVRLGTDDQAVLFTLHHIVSDGWSTGVLVGEVSRLYAAHCQGVDPDLPELSVQYADYAVWQREWLRGEVLERQLAWWRGTLAGAPPLLELPTDRVRPAVQGTRAGRVPFALDRETADRLREHARRHGATPFMLLLAALQALLSRYTGDDDVLVGTPVAGRTRPEVEGLIGLFVNTLVVRGDLSGAPDFATVLRRTRARVLEAQAHQELPFERLVDALAVERTRAHAPLAQVMFTLLDVEGDALPEFAGVRAEPLAVRPGAAKADLVLALADRGDGMDGELEYRAELWDAETMERMLAHLRALVAGMLAAPDRPVHSIPLLAGPERARVLEEWNDTATPLPDASVPALVAELAARAPDAPAIEWGAESLTYAEWQARAARLAHQLVALGVRGDARVGLCLERGVDTLVAMLAALQAGGAYVVVDGKAPPERVRDTLADAGCTAILTHAAWTGHLPGRVDALRLDDPAVAAALAALPAAPPAVTVHPDHLACVIYTSGSTGKPKGVAVTHRGLVRLARNTNYMRLGPWERVAQTSSTAFDAATFEIWGALLNGGTVVGVDRDDLSLSPADFAAELRTRRISTLFLTTTLFNRIAREAPDTFAGVGHVLFGAEAADPVAVRMVLAGQAPGRLLHMYGPTETTTYATWYPVRDVPPGATTVPIGGPVSNTTLYVLDAGGTPAAIDVPGELYVGGAGLARGYLGRPALTAERFLPDAYSGVPGARLYRTGDRVRWRAAGALEFLGRTDLQVKLRGFRIELAEIERALARHPGVGAAVAMVREDTPGARRLVAYVTPGAGDAPTPAELRAHVAGLLPEYMVPAAVVPLERIPVTPGGKADRRALPAPVWGGDEDAYQPPETPVERVLARVWEEVLRVERVGANDRFFDLGGDSILSIQVVARARREGVKLTARALVEHPTLAELARVAELATDGATDDALPAGDLPLTPIQHWFFELDAGDHAHWNQAFLFAPRHPLEPAGLARALAGAIDHHDALRLRFARGADGAWTQRYAEPGGPVPLVTVDLSRLSERDRTARMEAAAAALQASLDLSRGPLLRAARFDLGGDGERLLLAIHHLAVDGVSWRVLLEDLQRLYEGAPLPPKTTSFGRWAQRLAEHAATGALDGEAEYWTDPARRDAPRLPVDHADGENRVSSVSHVDVALDADETHALLHEANAAYGTQAADLLLAALARCLGEWTGDRRALVHLEGHGREELFADADLSRTVGWFTTMFPVLLDLGDDPDEGETLKEIKEQIRAIPAHGIGYGLLRYLSPDEAVRQALRELPAPEISFNYLGQFDGTLSGDALFSLAREPIGADHAPGGRRAHLLDVTAAVENGTLQTRWSYSAAVHRAATVRALAERWHDALRDLIDHCLSPEAGGHTPSDFPLAGLDAEALALLEADFA